MIYFKLNFYCLCSSQNSSLKLTKTQAHLSNLICQKNQCRSTRGLSILIPPISMYHSSTITFLSSGKSHKLPFLTTTTTNSIWEVWTVMKFGCRKATCLCSKVKLTSSEVFHQKEQFSIVGRGISKFYYKGLTIWSPLWCAREL